MIVKHRTAAAAMIAALVIVLALCFGKNAAMALFDQSKAVHIKPSEIENGTLIIGTHLIYLHSLNGEIYEIAVQSASDSAQDKRYYKSELAGGIWMDITYAESISDIAGGGTVADESEIERLYLTHHTKSDGITYNLQTNQAVCIYDIHNVYDLNNLPELDPLKLRYDQMREYNINSTNINFVRGFLTLRFDIEASLDDAQNDEDEKYKQQLEALKSYYEGLDIDNAEDRAKQYESRFETIEEYEHQLVVLQRYYEELAANNADSKYLETTLAVMKKISNTRKVQVFGIVSEMLKTLEDAVTREADDSSPLDDDLMAAMEESMYALEESSAEAAADMLSAQDGVISEKEYELCTLMLSNAGKKNYEECDKQNLQLQYLNNINNDRIVSASGELALLEELIEKADVRYGAELSSGMQPQYQMLVSQHASHAARENRMNADMAGADVARSDLEFLIQGIVDRRESIAALSGEETQKYILQKIQEAAKFKAVIKQDDYAQKYQDSVTGYVQWLNSLLASVTAADSSQSGEKTLYEQKENLQEQKLKALDALDLDTAKRIDAQIADIDGKIDALETVQSKKLEEMTAQKTALESRVSTVSQNKELQEELSGIEEQLAAVKSEKQTELEERRAEVEAELLRNPQDEALRELLGSIEEQLAAAQQEQKTQLESRKAELEAKLLQNPQDKEVETELSSIEEQLALMQPEKKAELEERKAQLEAQLSPSAQDMETQAELSRLEAQLAAGQSALSGSSQAAKIMESKNEILGLLADGDTGNAAMGQLESQVDVLAEMLADGSPLALASMKEVYGQMLAKAELGEVSAYDALLDTIETAVSESTVSADLTDTVSLERAGDIIADELGIGNLLAEDGSIDLESAAKAPQEDLLAALVALGDFTDANADDSLTALAEGLASALEQNPASAVFQTQKLQNESYVPVETLAQYLGYRYVWNDTRKNAILSKGREFFSFTAYEDQATTEKGEALSMEKQAVFSKQLLIPGSFVQKQFDCYVYDISGTDYSVLVNDKVVAKSQDILSELSKGF